MNKKIYALIISVTCSIFTLGTAAYAQGTAFSYQGRLNSGTNPAAGSYDFTFTLFNTNLSGVGSPVSATVTNSGTSVSNGLFTVSVDFGSAPFATGVPLWLEIGTRTNGAVTFSTLIPRQAVLSTPYAVYAETANAAGLTSGSVPDARLSANVALLNTNQTFTGSNNFNAGTSFNGPVTVARSASGVPSGSSIDPSTFVHVNNTATDGNTSSPDVAGIGFGNNSTRQAIVGGTFGNDYLDFYTGGLLTTPKMRVDINGGLTINDPRTGSFGTGGAITLNDYFSGTAESSIIGSIGNGGGFTWRNGALELRPPSRLNIYKGNDVTSSGNVALTVIGSSGNVGIGTSTPGFALDVNGIVNATGFAGAGTGLSGVALLSSNNAFTGTQIITGNVGIGTNGPVKKLEVAGSVPAVASGGSIESSVLMRLDNIATDGGGASTDFVGIGFGNNSTRQAIVGGTFGNDFLDFYTGGALTLPKMRMDFNGNITLNDPRTGSSGSGAQITFNDYFFGTAESSIIGSIGNGGGFSWRNGALELRPAARLNIYNGTDVTSSSKVAFTVLGSSGFVGIGTTTPTAHLSVATLNGTVNISDDSFTPALVMTGGPAPGILRLRNGLEVWPNTNGTIAGNLSVRSTNGVNVIDLDGSTGEITCVAINLTSDRNAKTDFARVNPREVLDKVSRLPISEWQYKGGNQSDARHIGPMAQDFHEAFTLGHDEKHISVIDEGGVALAAIQGLNEKLEETRTENAELRQTVNELKNLVEQLKQHVTDRKGE